jgi:hypothetical protein
VERGQEVVEVEGLASKNSLPLSDRDVPGSSWGDLDLVPVARDVLEVDFQVFAGLDAASREGEERAIISFVPGKIGGGELPLLPRSIDFVV